MAPRREHEVWFLRIGARPNQSHGGCGQGRGCCCKNDEGGRRQHRQRQDDHKQARAARVGEADEAAAHLLTVGLVLAQAQDHPRREAADEQHVAQTRKREVIGPPVRSDHGEGGEVYGGHHDGDDEPQYPIGALRRVDEEHDGSEKDL